MQRTVGAVLAEVRTAVPAPSARTYSAGLTALGRRFGVIELSEVSVLDLRRLRDHIEASAGERIVSRARARGRQLRSYDPRSFGQGAAGNFVMACRFFFRYCVDAGWLLHSPAADLHPPRRHPSL